MQTTNKELIPKSDLILRGWTVGLITKHLGEPDKLETNPHYKSGPPIKLYDLARVKLLEIEPWFLAAKSERATRSVSAKKAAEKRRQETLKWVESLDIKIPEIPLSRLYDLACDHYNAMQWRLGNFERFACISDSPEFLARISKNYLRHKRTNYEEQLERLFGKVGTDEAYNRLKNRINSAISKAYPQLT